MKIITIIHYNKGALTLKGNNITDILNQIKTIEKLSKLYSNKINIPDIKTIYQRSTSIIIMSTEIIKQQRPIKNIEQLITQETYKQLTYRQKITVNKEKKIPPVINKIFMQVNSQTQNVDITASLQDGKINRAFSMKLEKKKNTWIGTEIEYG